MLPRESRVFTVTRLPALVGSVISVGTRHCGSYSVKTVRATGEPAASVRLVWSPRELREYAVWLPSKSVSEAMKPGEGSFSDEGIAAALPTAAANDNAITAMARHTLLLIETVTFAASQPWP
jgi:hypothetical protein